MKCGGGLLLIENAKIVYISMEEFRCFFCTFIASQWNSQKEGKVVP